MRGVQHAAPAGYGMASSAAASHRPPPLHTGSHSHPGGGPRRGAGGAPQPPPRLDEEDAARRIETRQRQIDFGKATSGYAVYRLFVPLEARGPNPRRHPRTPDPHGATSKREWDGYVRQWRRDLHAYDFADPGSLGIVLPEASNEVTAAVAVTSPTPLRGTPAAGAASASAVATALASLPLPPSLAAAAQRASSRAASAPLASPPPGFVPVTPAYLRAGAAAAGAGAEGARGGSSAAEAAPPAKRARLDPGTPTL